MVADVLHHHGFIVDVAEAAIAVDHAHGVVAGRAHQGEGPVLFLFQHQARGGDGPAGRGQVGVRAHRAHRGQAEMGARQLGVAGEGRPVFADAGDVEEALFLQLVAGVEQALLALRVRGGNGPVKGREKDHTQTAGGRKGLSTHRDHPYFQKYRPHNGPRKPFRQKNPEPGHRPGCFPPRR